MTTTLTGGGFAASDTVKLLAQPSEAGFSLLAESLQGTLTFLTEPRQATLDFLAEPGPVYFRLVMEPSKWLKHRPRAGPVAVDSVVPVLVACRARSRQWALRRERPKRLRVRDAVVRDGRHRPRRRRGGGEGQYDQDDERREARRQDDSLRPGNDSIGKSIAKCTRRTQQAGKRDSGTQRPGR